MDGVQCIGGSDQDHTQEEKCKKAKWLSEEAFKIADKCRESKAKQKSKAIPI